MAIEAIAEGSAPILSYGLSVYFTNLAIVINI